MESRRKLNVSKFEIETSADGRNFIKIGTKDISNDYYYNFVDETTIGTPKMYYRIKTINTNGSFKYSSIVTISGKSFGISFSPNPVVDNIVISGLENGEGVISIYDLAGKLMMKKQVSNVQSLSLDLTSLNKGTYFVEYVNANSKNTKQFFKQ